MSPGQKLSSESERLVQRYKQLCGYGVVVTAPRRMHRSDRISLQKAMLDKHRADFCNSLPRYPGSSDKLNGVGFFA